MPDLIDWIEHRMRLLEIEGRAALAELADLGDEVFADLWDLRRLEPLQQSQRRRLACSLQVSLRKLYALDEGTLPWVEDEDRYLANAPAAPDPEEVFPDRGSFGRPNSSARPSAPRHPVATIPSALRSEAPQGTPVLGRVKWGGKIDPDECWDEQWGRRLPDGQPQRQDTYALETELAGQFVVVRNAAPWEARQGSIVALFVSDGFEGVGYFGQLVRGAAGGWRVRPCHGGAGNEAAAGPAAGIFAEGPVTLPPDQVQRIGRLVRRWPEAPPRG